MTLEHEPLRLRERAWLAQDVLRDRELAQVVEAPCEPGQLDLLPVDAEPGRDPGGELGHALGVAAGVDVAGVDGLGEARCRPEAGSPVGAGREPLQLGDLDDVGAEDPDSVLAVLLGPVEGAVRLAHELVPVEPLRGHGGDPRADGDRTGRPRRRQLHGRDPLHDRLCRQLRPFLVPAGEEDRELVAAHPERLAALA